MDTRAVVGRATLLMYVADVGDEAVPCGSQRGVAVGTKLVTLTNSLQFATPELAARWAAGADHAAVADVMKTLRTTPAS